MKKQSFRRRSFERVSLLSPNVRTLGVLVLVVVVLLGLFRFAFPGALVGLASPIWGLGSALTSGFGGFADSFGDTRMLTEDRDRLLEENVALSAELAALRAELADYTKIESGEGVRAGVLARPPVAPYDVLILEGGSENGVRVGQLVYGNGGVPVGVIQEVTPSVSRAALFSEAGRETHGWAGEERIPIVLRGLGSGTFSLVVSKDAGLVQGQEIYLPGPGALPVGIVSRVESDPSSPDAEVFVFPYANPFTLSQVRIGPASLP